MLTIIKNTMMSIIYKIADVLKSKKTLSFGRPFSFVMLLKISPRFEYLVIFTNGLYTQDMKSQFYLVCELRDALSHNVFVSCA